MKSREDYIERLKEIPWFQKNGKEYLPFVGEDYPKYRILHVGESHYIGNDPQENLITLRDFDGWWEGEKNKRIENLKNKLLELNLDGYISNIEFKEKNDNYNKMLLFV